DVCGVDVSETAVRAAREREPGCRFFELGAPDLPRGAFDLVFSHHVLEHVPDLGAALATIAALASPRGEMLHILPCGNAGSFEERIVALRRGGTDPALENRFFFEDEGH